jgi:hypothetical protein
MRTLVRTAILAVLAMLSISALAAGAQAAERKQPKAATPYWMKSKEVRQRIRAAGDDGVRIRKIRRWVRNGVAGRRAQQEDPPMMPCPTVDPSSADVYSGQCVVHPAGCTANFIFKIGSEPLPAVSDGRTAFIGTAGHCVDRSNQTVYMQRGPTIIAVGVVRKHTDGGIGNDFAAILIDRGLTIDPRNPAGGPQGIYTGCEPQGVKYYGHGFGVVVGQGKVVGGVATNWFERAFAWTGVALPGDSGSGVTIAGTDEAAGDLTHLVIDSRYPGSDVAGTRVTRILGYLGGNFHLVNQDRTTARATMADTACGNANNGGGGALLPTLPLP